MFFRDCRTGLAQEFCFPGLYDGDVVLVQNVVQEYLFISDIYRPHFQAFRGFPKEIYDDYIFVSSKGSQLKFLKYFNEGWGEKSKVVELLN